MEQFRGWAWDDAYDYECKQGDVWDNLARQAYDDEFLAPLLMYANPEHADIVVFRGGETIRIPVISPSANSSAPPWRAGV